MKTLIQKLPLEKDASFVARIYETPEFETPNHQHNEFELIAFTKGTGTAFIGDYIAEYKAGDVFFLGNNLPHWFKKKENDNVGAAMVVQFKEDFLGKDFFTIPEMSSIKNLLHKSSRGISCSGKIKKLIQNHLPQLEFLDGFKKTISLLNLLYAISISDEYDFVSSFDEYRYSEHDMYLINLVFEFSLKNFKRKIELKEVAALTHKSVSAFSHYFKKVTKVGYVHFLTQIRIAHACKMLKETNLNVTEICYASGFFNWANFSKHFRVICGLSPSAYRKRYGYNKNYLHG